MDSSIKIPKTNRCLVNGNFEFGKSLCSLELVVTQIDIWYLTFIGFFMGEEWSRNCFSHIQNMQSHTRQWGWELLSQDFRRSPKELCEFTMDTLQLPSANSEIFKATCWVKWWFAIGPYVHLEQQSLTLAVHWKSSGP